MLTTKPTGGPLDNRHGRVTRVQGRGTRVQGGLHSHEERDLATIIAIEKSIRLAEKRDNKGLYYGIPPTKEQMESDMEGDIGVVGHLMYYGTNDDDEGEQRRQGAGDSSGGPDDSLPGGMLTTP